MTVPTLKRCLVPVFLILTIIALGACSVSPGDGLVFGPTATPTITPTLTVTPIPPAVTVNGEVITKPELDAEVVRYQKAQADLGKTVSPEEARQIVINDMVDSLLLAQGAAGYGYVVDDSTLQERIDALTSQVGGTDALTAWETAQGYADVSFRSALRLQMEAAWMRDRVVASVPSTADQVHVKQILLYNASDAQLVLADLQTGVSFDDLAARYDPVTEGDLGWFPRGYLSDPDLEAAAFALQPGQYSQIIQDEIGYHILYLIERDPARLLSPDALLTLQARALQDWLAQRRDESTILVAP